VSILQDGLAGDLTDQQREYLAIALRNADTLSEMLEHLLVLTRIEQGRYRVFPSRVRLQDLLADGAFLAGPNRMGKQVDLRVLIPEAVPDIFADADRIREAIRNILDNAVKYSGDSVEILVRAEGGSGHMVDLSVRDNGLGMAPATIRSLFRRFYRGSAARKASPRGLGLGLAIVKEIVARHGGRIAVRSAIGEGTEIRLSLPKYEPKGILVGSLRSAWRGIADGGEGFGFVKSAVRGWKGAQTPSARELAQLVRESCRRLLGPEDSILANGESGPSISLLLAGEKQAMPEAIRRVQRGVADGLRFRSGIEIEWGSEPIMLHSEDYRNPEQMAAAIRCREGSAEGLVNVS